jgi:hypothetical protein
MTSALEIYTIYMIVSPALIHLEIRVWSWMGERKEVWEGNIESKIEELFSFY